MLTRAGRLGCGRYWGGDDEMTSSSNTAFTVFHSENRPLSVELARRAYETAAPDGRTLQQIMSTAETSSGVDDLECAIPAILATMRALAPKLHTPRYGQPRTASRRGYEPVIRYVVEVPVSGDVHLVQYWPDAAEDCPAPVNAAVVERLATEEHWTSEQTHEDAEAATMWTIRPRSRAGDDGWAIVTTFDLTDEEVTSLAGSNHLNLKIQERLNHVDGILKKIAEQVASYVDELADELRVWIDNKRSKVAARQTLLDSLAIPPEWQGREPVLAKPAAADKTADATTDAQSPTAAASAREVSLAPSERLAPASFEQAIKVIRQWANVVTRAPVAFGSLPEDHLSDLLAATLNATLPGAGREVYSRGGKTDIFIQADTLQGHGPAKVFICEAKKNPTVQGVGSALIPQLRGYLVADDTAAVLLLFLNNRDFGAAVDARLEALRGMAGYVEDGHEISQWPVLNYRWDGRLVRVCVASISIYPKEVSP